MTTRRSSLTAAYSTAMPTLFRAARVADGGLQAYHEHASEEVLGRQWRSLLEELA